MLDGQLHFQILFIFINSVSSSDSFSNTHSFKSWNKIHVEVVKLFDDQLCYIFIQFMKIVIITLVISVAVSFQESGESLKIKRNSLHLPVLEVCGDILLLLDTGSSDSWISHEDCSQCQFTSKLCPPFKTVEDKINYLGGSVQGSNSIIKTCIGELKMLCAVYTEGMSNLGAMGIVGLSGQSEGKKIIKNLFYRFNIKKKTFAFYNGIKQSRLFLGQIPHKYIGKQITIFQGSAEWQVKISGWSYLGRESQFNSNYELFFDTGSNMLTLPTVLYDQTIKLTQMYMNEKGCSQTKDSLKFYCPYKVDFSEIIGFKLIENQTDLSFSAQKLIKKEQYSITFLIQKGVNQNMITLGGTLTNQYILEFDFSGNISIYTNNLQLLSSQEINNYKIILLEYLLMMIFLAFVGSKLYQTVQQALNRKIVI